MNWKGMHAWARCKVSFGKNVGAFQAAMDKYAPGSTLDSCSVTQSVLGMVISPGKPLTTAAVKTSDLGVKDPTDAAAQVSKLLGGDNVVYLSISPNHYFTVLPLSSSEIALLQGFQGSYNLFQWLQAKDGGVMAKSAFLMHFFLLFSSSTAVAQDAAEALFAIPGTEAAIRDWFKNGNIRLTQLGYCAL